MVFSKVLSFVEFVNENYSNIESINEEKNFFIPTREDIIGVLDIQKKTIVTGKQIGRAHV